MLEVELVGAHQVESQHEHECSNTEGGYAKTSIDEGLGNVCATTAGSVLHLVGSGIGKGFSYGLWLHSALVGTTIENEGTECQYHI